jgi:thiol:disulfide interchange protein DsbD
MACDDSKCLPPEYLDFTFNLMAKPQPDKKSGVKMEVNEPKAQAKTDNTEKEIPEAEPLIQEPETNNGIFNPVSWDFKLNKLGAGEYEILLDAKLEKGWHIYSQNLPTGDGPVATEVNFFNAEGNYSVSGKAKEEGDLLNEYDPNFMMELAYFENDVTFRQKLTQVTGDTVRGEVYYMVCNEKMCLPPEAIEFALEIPENKNLAVTNSEKPAYGAGSNRSIIAIFIAGFLGGLLALLTPCVFPMIPLTVSFFTKQSKTKAQGISNAILYGVSIIGIYTILGYLVTAIFGADALNALSTNFWFNIAFFVLLTVFAISFFGAFEITLPSSWVNKMDSKSDKGGLLGIFFMAFTLSLVSFSCTGPIIGTLLVEAAVNGGVAGPLVGMGGFSLALALPFGLFAAFPGWMNSLPQSGGWLNSVKVVLGFLELGLALKFLSNADLVIQAGILTRELFISLWIAISAGLTLYLFGFVRMPHDSPLDRLSVGRMLFGIVTLTFTLYLIPGLWGAPLKLISGFPPPMFYSESPNGVGKATTMIAAAGNTTHNKKTSHATCPHNLNCFHDYEEGMAYAKEVGKPVMLDFTGWACVNCRKMEEQVWAEPPVLQRMQENVVLISLYVDEKTELPKEEQYVSETTGKKIKTIGNKWSDLQIKEYKSNSQPYYVILDHDKNQLIESASYDPDVDKFVDWLDRGVAEFQKTQK